MLKYKKMELCLQSFISSTFLSVPNAARIVVRRNVFCTSLAHAINFTLLVYASYNFPIQIVCSPLSRNPTQDNKINNQVGDGLVLFTTVAQAGFLFRNDSSRNEPWKTTTWFYVNIVFMLENRSQRCKYRLTRPLKRYQRPILKSCRCTILS